MRSRRRSPLSAGAGTWIRAERPARRGDRHHPGQYQRAGTQAAAGAVSMTDGGRDNDKVCEIAEELVSAMRRADRPRIRGLGG